MWVAGQTATRDAHQILKRAGGSLANVVTMTVFIKESRYGERFVEMRKDMFQNGNYRAARSSP